jgi:hypothetical protein
MKQIIMIIAFISWAVTTVHAGDIVVERPSFGVSSRFDYIEIEKIVLNDTATILYCKGFNLPGYWISITRCYLQANGKKYPVRHAVDIEFDKETFANQQGEIAFSMIFPPIDANTQYFDLIEEDNPQDKGRIWDIAFRAKKAKSYGKLPKEFRKAARTKDDGTLLAPPAWREAKAVLKGRIAGYRPEMEYYLNIYFPNIITGFLENHSVEVNGDGSFEISVPMVVATQVWLRFGYRVFKGNRVRTNGKVLLTPGDTAQLYVDLPACFKSVSRLRKDRKPQKSLYFSGTNADINNQISDISSPKYIEKYTEVFKDTSFLKMDIQEYKNHILQIKKECTAEISGSKSLTSKVKDFFRMDLDYLTANALLIKVDGIRARFLSTMPDVEYYDFLRDLPLNNPLSLYSSEYANTLTVCRFIKTGENETRQKEDILQEMIQADNKDGLFFDLMRCRRICALAPMKPEDIEEETDRIRDPFLTQYLEKKRKLNATAEFPAGFLDTIAIKWKMINIYEAGMPITSCECNFDNLLKNWNRWIANRDEVKLLSYEYVETLKDEARIAHYANVMYNMESAVSTGYGNGMRSWSNEDGSTEYRFRHIINIGKASDSWERLEDAKQRSLAKEELEKIFDRMKDTYFKEVHTGDKVYLLKFEANGNVYDYYVICNSATNGIHTMDFLTRTGGEREGIKNWLNSQTSNFAAFEWSLNRKLPEEKGKINLYGFKTVSLPENDRQKFKDMPAEQIEEMKKLNTVLADDFSSCRFYFPFSEAIIEYEGATYTADENGRIEMPGTDVHKISIIGRAPSDKVKGSKFEKPLKLENDSYAMFGQHTLIFDCGEFNGME